jgi:CHAT domain-containing protein/tetratricopeptide (TPR) repeat protein
MIQRLARCLVVFAALAVALPACADEPDVSRRKERIAERDRLWREAEKLRAEGKLKEAAARGEKMVAIDREVFGNAHREVAFSLNWLAEVYQGLEDFAAAQKARRERLEVIGQLYGQDHWHATDARLALADVERLAALDAETRRQLQEADAWNRQVVALAGEKKYRDALTIARQVAQRRQQILGELHADYATSLNNLGYLHSKLGEREQAETLFRQTLELRRKIFGEAHPTYAASLNELGYLYRAMRDYARAETLLRQGLELQGKTLGQESPVYATSLDTLAALYETRGELARAEPLYCQALAIRKKVLGQEHPDYATSANNLAVFYKSKGDYARAGPLVREALAIRKKILGEQHADYATSLNTLAGLCKDQGDFRAAEPLYRQAIEIYREALGTQHGNYAAALNNLAVLYKAMGDYVRAEPLFTEAMAIRKNVLGEMHPDYAASLSNLAELYQTMGDHARAEALYRQALDVMKQAVGEEHPSYATALNNLALLYESRGDYVRAVSLLQRTLEIKRKVLGKQHPSYGNTANNLAVLYQSMGDDARAESLYQDVLAVKKQTLGEDHPSYALTLGNLGLFYESTGDYARAEPLLQQAYEIRKKRLGDEHPECAVNLNNLALLYEEMGDYARAETCFQQALAIDRKVFGQGHPNSAAVLLNLGRLYRTTGDYARAEACSLEVRELWKKALGEEHRNYAVCLHNLGFLYAGMGEDARAEPFHRQALEIIRRHVELTSAVQSERQQLANAEAMQRYLHAYVSLAVRRGEFVEPAYRHTLAWKGTVLGRQRQLRAVADDPKLKPVWNELQSTAARLATLALAAAEPKTTDMETHRRQIAQLSAEKERLEAELAGASEAFRQAQKRATLEELQAALPADVALVDFLEHLQWRPPEDGKKGEGIVQWRLAAFVVRANGPIRLFDLGPPEPIGEAVDRWRAEIRARQGGPARGQRGLALEKTQPADESARAALARAVWKPLEAQLAGAATILISPDGATARLPFAALPGKKAGTYLIEDVALAVIAVPQGLPELVGRERSRLAASLLLVGDVDFGDANFGGAEPAARGAESSRGVLPATRFRPLAGTAQEIEAIAATLKQAQPDAPLAVLRKADATEQQFRRLVPAHRFVHLATHGYFAPPEVKSALDHSDDSQRSSRQAFASLEGAQQLVGLNPGLLSGIALAGANRGAAQNAAAGEQEDGLLTALEAGGLDLRGTDLVTLSACETGLGKTAGGEGVLGLQRAFEIAGCSTTVTSLWSVDDDATQTLMSAFYENLWTHKMETLAALRAAQLTMLHGYDPERKTLTAAGDASADAAATRKPLSPYYWAAFVLSGDWR